jgi:hypothetical protein
VTAGVPILICGLGDKSFFLTVPVPTVSAFGGKADINIVRIRLNYQFPDRGKVAGHRFRFNRRSPT